MVSVFLIFLITLAASFPMGFAVLAFLEHFLCTESAKQKNSLCSFSLAQICTAGLAAAAVYAQTWSLFGGVGVQCFAVFVILAVVSAAIFRKDLLAYGKANNSLSRSVLILLLLLLCAFITSHGIMHYDSDLYHAQSIRWIETYGAVKGLANLHNRLGYNSAAFALSALFSFSFTGQSFHVVQGFWYFLLLLVSLQGLFAKGSERESLPYRFLCLASLYYLAAVSDEIVSPASDCFMVLIAFLLLLFFLQEGFRAKDTAALADMTCILFPGIVFLVTVKLSAAGLLLLGLFPLARCIRRREGKRILAVFLISLAAALPFLIRNIILTGYLIYPVPSIDLFSVFWKVPKGQTEYDALEIRAYGRGFTDVISADVPLSSWLPAWFAAQTALDQVFLLLCIAGLVPAAGILVRAWKGSLHDKCLAALDIALMGSLLIWLFGAPLFRYGCIFVYAFAAVNMGAAVASAFRKWSRLSRIGERIFVVLCALFFFYKTASVVREQAEYLKSGAVMRTLVRQQDYGTYACSTFQIGGVTFYYPTQGDQTGYAAFPSAPTDRSQKIGMVSDRLKDGFYALP